MEVFGCIFDAAEDCLIGYCSGHADYEQVSQSLVEEQFGRDSRVRAGEYRGKRVLARRNRCSRCRSNVYRVETPLPVLLVAGLETLQRLVGIDMDRARLSAGASG